MTTLTFSSMNGLFNLSIPTDLWGEMGRLCQDANRLETGGILIGYYEHESNQATITQIIGPSVDSKSGKDWFFRGVKGLQPILDTLWQARQEYYLGEWHFHPYASPKPSCQDIKQMRQIAQTAAYNCPEPVLMIVGGNPKENPLLNAYIILSTEDPIQLFPH